MKSSSSASRGDADAHDQLDTAEIDGVITGWMRARGGIAPTTELIRRTVAAPAPLLPAARAMRVSPLNALQEE
jgi:hypothetical protein